MWVPEYSGGQSRGRTLRNPAQCQRHEGLEHSPGKPSGDPELKGPSGLQRIQAGHALAKPWAVAKSMDERGELGIL